MTRILTDASEPVNMMYYGDGGTGKTTDMATMANLGKVLAINAESGIKGGALRRRGVNIGNIEVYPDPGDPLSYEGLEAEWLRVRELLNKEPGAYVGVFWDPVSEIQKAFVEAEATDAVRRAGLRGQERNPFVKDRDNWNIANDQLRLLIRRFRDLPCHFCMAATFRREVDNDGVVVYQPNVTPSMQNDIYGWMDVVCVTFVEQVGGEDEYRGLFRPHGKYRGKDRFSAVPKWLVDPTFERVLQYVEGDLEVSGDSVMKAAEVRFRAAQQKAEASGPAASGTNDNRTEERKAA